MKLKLIQKEKRKVVHRLSEETKVDVKLENALNKKRKIIVTVDSSGPLPPTPGYKKIKEVEEFEFKLIDLLHATGSKVASLPLSERDECLKVAYALTASLDLEAENLCFKPGIDSDFQTDRSHELGVGMMSLLASNIYGIPIDQLESVKGPGKKFDYRGEADGIKGIFEAKGTKDKSKQHKQILDGLKKKNKHHERNEHYDVELIVSTSIGASREATPKILIADPEFNFQERAFGPKSKIIYKFRHYSRAMQFIGFPKIARQLYLTSMNPIEKFVNRPFRAIGNLNHLEEVPIGNLKFLGHWYDSWVPRESKRYSHLQPKESLLPKHPKFSVFQGIRKDVLNKIISGQLKDFSLEDGLIGDNFADTSIFNDGTILIIKFDEIYN